MSSRIARYNFFFFSYLLSSSVHLSDLLGGTMLFQINLEKSNKALIDLQESYRLAISTLKEKELIISKLLCSGKRTEKSLANGLHVVYCSIYKIIMCMCMNRKFFN